MTSILRPLGIAPILLREKRRMRDNECQNSCDLVIDLGEAATFIPNSSFEQSFHSGSKDRPSPKPLSFVLQ